MGRERCMLIGISPIHTGKGNIGVNMQRHPNKLAIGLIDTDKSDRVNQSKYFSEFQTTATNGNVRVLKHSQRNHYLIQINPPIEGFLINNALALGNIIQENFPNTAKELKKKTRKESISKDQSFINFVNRIIQRNPTEIIFIREQILAITNIN